MNQYEKRKAKSVETLVKEATTVAPVTAPVYDQKALDVYTLDGGRTYNVAQISYNSKTGESIVTDTFSISRLVALKYATMKEALSILQRRKIK